ncbi:GTPase HflX [Litoreibacter ponti]|uniref:GTPase HflX n=1 Tax=Litoreibacter ponti TaxID=1510457 RepID=UPI000D3152DC|nr:GTPase HflX [Litoreibacter ponti]
MTRAWVIHPDIKTAERRRLPEFALGEAVALAAALPGLEVIGSEITPLPKTRAGTLFGTGKIEELKQRLKDEEIELVLIDGPVTPVQQRNLEREWKVKILDRTGLILEIFSDRAATREGVLQVELAALSYQRTRLVRAWTHLERQRGGLGFVGGPGETQIEADRRAIDEAITRIRRQLEKTVKTRELHRAARAKVPYPVVALVGYTNAGKSTLFNRLTGAEVLVKDMLFATLDPTMRSVELPLDNGGALEIIMSDTVGFISDLPTQLVAAFRATLEEVLSADLILHVRDISHPETENQARDVRAIMADLGVDPEVPVLEVWNKLDRLAPDALETARNKAERDEAIFLTSALDGSGLDDLLARAAAHLRAGSTTEEITLDFSDGRARAWLFGQEVVDHEEQTEDGFKLTVTWTATQKGQFEKL